MRGLLILLLFLCANICYAQEKEPINRTWTSITGTKVDAELVSFTDREVVLKLKQGKTIKLRLDKLAEYDQYFLKGLEKAIVPEGGIKFHQLEDNALDLIQGKKGNKEYIHYLNKRRFSGVAYQMQTNTDKLNRGDEGYYTDVVSQIITFKSGLPNGLYKIFYENGQKQGEVKMRLDGTNSLLEEGLDIRWDESGKIISVKTYKDGEVVEGSEKKWNSKGEPVDSLKEANKK